MSQRMQSTSNTLRDEVFRNTHPPRVFDTTKDNNTYRIAHEEHTYLYSGFHDDDHFALRPAPSSLHEAPCSSEYDAPNRYNYPPSSSFRGVDTSYQQQQQSPAPFYYPGSSSFESTSSTNYPPQRITSSTTPHVPHPSHYPANAAYHAHHPYSGHASSYSYPPQLSPATPYYYANHGLSPYPSHLHWSQSPPQFAVLEYVTDIQPQDVLSGRGGATNSHSGNRAFRGLVKQYQGQYLKAKKKDKPAVASIIVDIIRKKGGRFLRRHDTNHLGEVLYVDIGDDRAREKTCQALREGAPELRKQKQQKKKRGGAVASEEEEDDDDEEEDDDEAEEDDDDDHENDDEKEECQVKRNDSFSKRSATHPDQTSTRTEHATNARPRKKRFIMSSKDEDLEEQAKSRDNSNMGPIMIRPISHFLPKESWDKEPISIDELSPEDREVYLRDFLPPCPSIRKKLSSSREHSNATEDIAGIGIVLDSSPWPIIEASV